MTRPDPGPPLEGCVWEARPDLFRRWEALPYEDHVRRCRWGASRSTRACGAPSVARLARGPMTRPQWWHYCGEHLYGRWVEDGVVMGWHPVDLPPVHYARPAGPPVCGAEVGARTALLSEVECEACRALMPPPLSSNW